MTDLIPVLWVGRSHPVNFVPHIPFHHLFLMKAAFVFAFVLQRQTSTLAYLVSKISCPNRARIACCNAVRAEKLSVNFDDDDDDQEVDEKNAGQVGNGPNWIERDFPNQPVNPKTIEDYSLGVDGDSFSTGDLSKRMHDAILSRSSFDTSDPEIQRSLKIYAMDFTAKEAVQASLTQNGLEFVDDNQDEGQWGEVDSIRFDGNLYDSWEDAVDQWTPGTSFSFVARHVPAKMAELSVDQLLQALDPDGALREQAKQSEQIILPDEEINSLPGLVALSERRIAKATTDVLEEPFTGNESRGYRALPVTDLMMTPPSVTTVYHVMEALVSHGCLVVELEENALDPMWKVVEDFFEYVDTSPDFPIPSLSEVPGLPNAAKVGYANYEDSEFLETRPTADGLMPQELERVLSNAQDLRAAFDRIAEVSKRLVTIVVAASTEEADILDDAWECSKLLAEELIDDGQGRSPHRLCRYRNDKAVGFGAHTDSTFITAVPVSQTPGLEVYDDDAEQWLRPEVKFNRERHVILMPGELLQIVSRDEVQASVHRVVSVGSPRISAPILFRGRNLKLDCDQYLGGTEGWELLKACDGRSLDDIHQELQEKIIS